MKAKNAVAVIAIIIMAMACFHFNNERNAAIDELNETQEKLEQTQNTVKSIVSNEEHSDSVLKHEYYSALESSKPKMKYFNGADIAPNKSDYLTKESDTFFAKNDDGGYNHETYHSSKVFKDHRINQWVADENGIYRDSDGYIVCEMFVEHDNNSDIQAGDVIETSLGQARAYSVYTNSGDYIYVDSNGNESYIHRISIYTNW